MKKQDRIAIRTPEAAVQVSRAQLQKFSDSVSLTVENEDTTASILLKVGDKLLPATIDMKGLVSFTNLKTPGKTQIDGGNITSGTILADLITAGVLRSKDEKSILLDLERGRADITGSFNVSGENEQGQLIGSLRPGFLQLAQTDTLGELLRQVQIIENGLIFLDSVSGKSLELRLENGKARLTGLDMPEGDADAVSKGYMEAYVFRKMDEIRNELGLPVG